jgi:hypothetical protein
MGTHHINKHKRLQQKWNKNIKNKKQRKYDQKKITQNSNNKKQNENKLKKLKLKIFTLFLLYNIPSSMYSFMSYYEDEVNLTVVVERH